MLTFQNEGSYEIATMNLPSLGANSFFLGDYYMLVRNQSGLNNISTVAGESTFQFMGDTVIPLRYRELPTAEAATSCLMGLIDASLLEELVVLDLYYNGNSADPGYNIYEFYFGNMASTIRVVPPVPANYLYFTFPTNTYNAQSSSRYQWDFLNTAAGNTNLTIYTENEKVVNHLQVDLFQWSGLWQRLASSDSCRLVKNTGNNTYVLYWYSSNGTSLLVSNTFDLTSALTGTSSWEVSKDCTKLKADANYFVYNGASYQAAVSPSGITALDSSLTYAITTSSVLRYNSNTNQYANFITNLTLSTNAKVQTYSNRVVVYDTSATGASIYSWLDNAGTGSLLLSFSTASLLNFSSTPVVRVSPQCSKVLILGMSAGSLKSYFYHLDYSGLSSTAVDFPLESVSVSNGSIYAYVEVEDSWIYVRQQVSVGSQEIVYAIVSSTVPVEADRRNISSADLACDQYKLRIIDNATLYVLSRCSNVSTSPIVTNWQIVPTQASGDTASEMGMSQVVIGGQIKLCSPGCSDCSTGTCTSCINGYVFDSDSKLCYLCPPGCSACDPANPSSCSKCLDGSFLSGTECLVCDPICTTCTGSATSCKSCLPGQYFDNSTGCTSCSRNCLNCTSASTCDACQKGFVPNAGVCRKCAQQCSSCAPSNIMYCTSCTDYLYLSSGQCLPCPSRCKKCNGATCAICDPGYHPSASGSCV